MGEVIARGGSLETPAASFLGGPGDAGPFDQLEIAMMATIGVTSAMASVDQPELIARPPAHWSV